MLTSIKKILCTKNPLQRYPFFFTHLQYYSDFFPTNVWAFTGWCVLPFSLRSIPTSRSESRAKAKRRQCGGSCARQEIRPNISDPIYKLYPKLYDHIMNFTNNGVTYRQALREMLRGGGYVFAR